MISWNLPLLLVIYDNKANIAHRFYNAPEVHAHNLLSCMFSNLDATIIVEVPILKFENFANNVSTIPIYQAFLSWESFPSYSIFLTHVSFEQVANHFTGWTLLLLM